MTIHEEHSATPEVHASDHAQLERLAPGLPPSHLRQTDVSPRAAKRAERQVAILFVVSMLGIVGSIVAFVAYPDAATTITLIPGLLDVSASNFFLGLTLGLGILCLGIGAIHWAKKLMSGEEIVEERHSAYSSDADREAFRAMFEAGVDDSAILSRPLIRRTLIGALLLLPLPMLVLLRDLGPLPRKMLDHTIITPQVRIVTDGPEPGPLRPEDIPIGGLVNAVPADLPEVEEREGTLNARAKATLMLIRLRPDQIVSQQGDNWDVQGILCFSKVCTHVGCPLGLYEQRTHHMLCPCHQSTFDLADSGRVIFGPAARRLPQLAITLDAEGYIVAQSDFTQPVGPSFWERDSS